MKKTIITVFSALFIALSTQAAVDVSVAYTSDYYFRGFQLADSIIEAAVDYSEGDFYAGMWTAQPFEGAGDGLVYLNEIDFYGGYGVALGDVASLDFGICAYVYPELDEGDEATYEPYIGLSFDAPLAPTAYVYYDLTLEILTVEGSLGYSIEVDETSTVDLGVALGSVMPDEGDSGLYWTASLGYSKSIGDTASFSASVNYNDGEDVLSSGNWDDGFYFSLGLSVGF